MTQENVVPLQSAQALMLDIFDLPVSFHRCLVPVTGSVAAALMLSQAIWTSQTLTTDAGGWFSKTWKEWEDETGLTPWEQGTARRALCDGGFVEERRIGASGRLWQRVRPDRVLHALQRHAVNHRRGMRTPT